MESLKFDFLNLLQFTKRPFPRAFVPSKIWTELDQSRGSFERLAKYLKRYHIELLKEFVTVAGEFDSDRRKIIIYVYDQYESAYQSDDDWEEFKFTLIQTIMHELIHWSQFSLWDYENPWSDQELLNPNEIQAYAHCIFLEEKIYKKPLKYSTLDMIKREVDKETLVEYHRWASRWGGKYSYWRDFNSQGL